MGCAGCTTCNTGDNPKGCKSNGSCATGGCNRLNTFDWLSQMEVVDIDPVDIVEVSFKNGARKNFYRLQEHTRIVTGDMVVVETGNGCDVGKVSLSGELVRLQMKKKRVEEEQVLHQVIRRANERDLERLQEARNAEVPTMVRARAIARTLGLEMKLGDVEYQGDKRKATFYYTADGRVDFRELIRHYAREFRVKIEMRQIGARQESARIGGIGSCGRELCCSTWLTDFKSVTTAAARYQNLAINQAKLSGQCGRLKCCLNYELDTYLEALEEFPDDAEKLETKVGIAAMIKTDIFQRIVYYAYQGGNKRGKIYALDLDRVKEIRNLNQQGEKPEDLMGREASVMIEADEEIDFADVTGEIELPMEERKKRKKKRRGRGSRRGGNPKSGDGHSGSHPRSQTKPSGDNNAKNKKRHSNKGRKKRNPKNKPPGDSQ